MKVLFFAPHSAIWVHAFPEALVAEALAKAGHDVLYVACGEEFRSYCTAMTAFGLKADARDEDKARICRMCKQSENLLREQFGFRGYTLSSRLTAADRAEIERLLQTVTPDNYLDFKVLDVEVGRMALYELLLGRKKGNLELSAEEWKEYRVALRNALASLFATARILEAEKPDRLITYNSLYAVNRVACLLAEKRGVPVYFLHAGGNLSRRLETLLIGRGDGVRFYDDLLAFWPQIKELPCPENLLAPVTDHILELFSGRSVFTYSSARTASAQSARQRLGIPGEARILVATMSSPDERFAAETIGVLRKDKPAVFPTQIEWIRALCEWVRSRSDLFLVVRVHPREFPNKREGMISDHARTLAEVLADMPPNAVVNWPSDGISLYDLADIADAFLNAWSAAGKEMTLLGIPVVAYAKDLLVYPPDLHYIGSSREDYFAKVELALREGWSIERARMAYRWCALEYERCVTDLGASFPWSRRRAAAKVRALLSRILGRLKLEHVVQWLDCRRRRPLSDASAIGAMMERQLATPFAAPDFGGARTSIDEETRVLRRQVARLVSSLYGSLPASVPPSALRENLQNFARASV
jgi:hypothetical protein